MNTYSKASLQRAIDKAQSLGGAKLAARVTSNTYRVTGSTGVIYIVGVNTDGTYTCTCKAGENERACYHQAAVWLHRLAMGLLPSPRKATQPVPVAASAEPAPLCPECHKRPGSANNPGGICNVCVLWGG